MKPVKIVREKRKVVSHSNLLKKISHKEKTGTDDNNNDQENTDKIEIAQSSFKMLLNKVKIGSERKSLFHQKKEQEVHLKGKRIPILTNKLKPSKKLQTLIDKSKPSTSKTEILKVLHGVQIPFPPNKIEPKNFFQRHGSTDIILTGELIGLESLKPSLRKSKNKHELLLTADNKGCSLETLKPSLEKSQNKHELLQTADNEGFSPEGPKPSPQKSQNKHDFLLTADNEGYTKLWSIKRKILQKNFGKIHRWGITSLHIYKKHNFFLTCDFKDASITKMFDHKSKFDIKTDILKNNKIYSICLSNDSEYLYTSDWDINIKQWQIGTKFEFNRIYNQIYHTSFVDCMQITKDNRYQFTSDHWGNLGQWDVNKVDVEIFYQKHHDHKIQCMCILDSRYIFTCDKNGNMKQLDFINKDCVKNYMGIHQWEIYSIIATNDGEKQFTSDYDGELKMWDVRSMKVVKYFGNIHGSCIKAMVVTPDDRYLFTSDCYSELKQWDLKTMKLAKNYGFVHQNCGITAMAI